MHLRFFNNVFTDGKYRNCFLCETPLKNYYVSIYFGTEVWPMRYACLNCGDEVGVMFSGKFLSLGFGEYKIISGVIPDYIPKQQWSKYLIKKVEEKRKHGYKGQYLVPK